MTNRRFQILTVDAAVALALMISVSCAQRQPAGNGAAASSSPSAGPVANGQIELRQMPAGKNFSGFLKDYSNLKPNPDLGKNALTFAKPDERRNLHRYIAIIVDPVQVYLASDADRSKLPEKGPGVGARYFHKALLEAVSGAFPPVDQPGPLVLRLRAALIGLDVGHEIPAAERSADSSDSFDRSIDISKVAVEMELVDSETGEQIAAMVDREKLGDGAQIGDAHFSRQEKWAAAREAFDGWAKRVRDFLDSAHKLSVEDVKRADQSYRPYSEQPANQK